MNAGYVYVIAFDDGTVKVGRTRDRRQRMKAHESDARKFGIAIADSWTSPLHAEWHQNEDALKVIAARCGGAQVRAEYFRNADYAAIVSAAAGLPFTAPAPAGPHQPVAAGPQPPTASPAPADDGWVIRPGEKPKMPTGILLRVALTFLADGIPPEHMNALREYELAVAMYDLTRILAAAGGPFLQALQSAEAAA